MDKFPTVSIKLGKFLKDKKEDVPDQFGKDVWRPRIASSVVRKAKESAKLFPLPILQKQQLTGPIANFNKE
jgi:hypothetical protein